MLLAAFGGCHERLPNATSNMLMWQPMAGAVCGCQRPPAACKCGSIWRLPWEAAKSTSSMQMWQSSGAVRGCQRQPAACKCSCCRWIFSRLSMHAAITANGYLPLIDHRGCHIHPSSPTTFYCPLPPTPSISLVKMMPSDLDSFIFLSEYYIFNRWRLPFWFYLHQFKFDPNRPN